MSGNEILFEQIRSSGCLSYVLGCAQEKTCIVIDPEIDKADDYAGLVKFFGAKLRLCHRHPHPRRPQLRLQAHA